MNINDLCHKLYAIFMHAVNRCGLLLQTSHVAWSVCKNGLLDRDADWGLTHLGPWNRILGGWCRSPNGKENF